MREVTKELGSFCLTVLCSGYQFTREQQVYESNKFMRATSLGELQVYESYKFMRATSLWELQVYDSYKFMKAGLAQWW